MGFYNINELDRLYGIEKDIKELELFKLMIPIGILACLIGYAYLLIP